MTHDTQYCRKSTSHQMALRSEVPGPRRSVDTILSVHTYIHTYTCTYLRTNLPSCIKYNIIESMNRYSLINCHTHTIYCHKLRTTIVKLIFVSHNTFPTSTVVLNSMTTNPQPFPSLAERPRIHFANFERSVYADAGSRPENLFLCTLLWAPK